MSQRQAVPNIVCPKCAGKGELPLARVHPELTLALDDVIRHRGMSAPEMAAFYDGVGTTALNQRLEHLRKLGLVRRKRSGRSWRYYAA